MANEKPKVGVAATRVGPLEHGTKDDLNPNMLCRATLSRAPELGPPPPGVKGIPFTFEIDMVSRVDTDTQLALLLALRGQLDESITTLQNEVATKGNRS